MHVVAGKRLGEFADKYKAASTWLMTFLERAEAAEWLNIADVRQMYPHADAVKTRSGKVAIVFNVCGNRFRLVTAIHFNRGKIYILRFMTHAEYDKELWKDQL